MTMDKLMAKAQSDIMDSMLESASTLAAGSGGLLQVYPPDRFGYQSVLPIHSHYRIDGTPDKDVEKLNVIAEAIDNRYKKLPAAIDEYDKTSGVFTQMSDYLKVGKNIALGMEHAELIDIALGLVAVSNKNRQMGIKHRSVLVASKAIDFLGVNIETFDIPPDITKEVLKGVNIDVEDDNTVPVRNFMSAANDATYLTVPDSKTFSKIRGIQGKAIRVFNGHSVRDLRNDMSRDNDDDSLPVLLGVALPGTTVKSLDIDSMSEEMRQLYYVEAGQEVDLIGRINPSVPRFMLDALTYAIAIRLNDGSPKVEADKDFVRLKSAADIKVIAGKMIKLAQKLEPGKRFIYDEDGDLPIVRK